MVSSTWGVVCIHKHKPLLALRDHKFRCSEVLRDIKENSIFETKHALELVETSEVGGTRKVMVRNGVCLGV